MLLRRRRPAQLPKRKLHEGADRKIVVTPLQKPSVVEKKSGHQCTKASLLEQRDRPTMKVSTSASHC
jgi:hypothetical protein